MKKLTTLLLVVSILAAGCTGSFILTKKVYNFHRGQDGKWMDEVMFLGVVILPVYGLAQLGDVIIFNTIEFWTDENPLEAKIVGEPDEFQVKMAETNSNAVRIASLDDSASLVFERGYNGVVAKDDRGNVLYVSKTEVDGGVSVYDANNVLVNNFSASQVEAAKRKVLQ
ncbi:MAG: DUF3332 family protein [Candidatus Omnitrophota bacterium]